MWVIVLVVLAVGGLVAARLISPPSKAPSAPTSASAAEIGKPASASLLSAIRSAAIATPTDVSGQNATVPTFTKTPFSSAGKPVFLYMGAEYCPYCAAERWALLVALNRFGTFSNLHYMLSSSTDKYPNTPTFTFYKSTYTSPYVTFTPVEMETRDEFVALQQPTSAERNFLVANDPSTSIPFFSVGNYVWTGTQVDPALLQGLSWSTIADQLKRPVAGSAGGQIMQSANIITAAICKSDGNQPSAVCSSPEITSMDTALPQ